MENKQVIKRLYQDYIVPKKWWFLFATLLSAIAGATVGGVFRILEPVLNEIFLEKDGSRLYYLSFLVFLAFVIRGMCTYGQQVIMTKIGSVMVKDIQVRLSGKIITQSQNFFTKNASGHLQATFQNRPSIIRQMVINLVRAIKNIVALISLISVMFYANWSLAIVALIVLPVAILPLRKLTKKMKNLSKSLHSEGGLMLSVVGETVRNIKVVQSYTQEDEEMRKIEHSAEKMMRFSFNRERFILMTSPLMETLGGVAISCVVLYGGYQVIHLGMEPTKFMIFIGSALSIYEPIKKLSSYPVSMQLGLMAAEQIYNIIDSEPTIRDRASARDIDVKKGSISFENLYFSYHDVADEIDLTFSGDEKDKPKNPSKNPAAIRHINLDIEAGQTVALVGHSGSGKSTVVNLIQRFWDPQYGRILIDDQNIKDVTLKSLRSSISFVGQEVTLFDMTIRDNIAYGLPSASDDEVRAAAKNANADEFIQKQDEVYNTKVGEQGIKLSGGQRQRISIARAMIKNSPILLLDEATSALDTESEKLVQEALSRLMKDKTVIVVAHRLSTVINADLICVMKDGEIVEKGNHEELIQKDSHYKRMYDVQFKK